MQLWHRLYIYQSSNFPKLFLNVAKYVFNQKRNVAKKNYIDFSKRTHILEFSKRKRRINNMERKKYLLKN